MNPYDSPPPDRTATGDSLRDHLHRARAVAFWLFLVSPFISFAVYAVAVTVQGMLGR